MYDFEIIDGRDPIVYGNLLINELEENGRYFKVLMDLLDLEEALREKKLGEPARALEEFFTDLDYRGQDRGPLDFLLAYLRGLEGENPQPRRTPGPRELMALADLVRESGSLDLVLENSKFILEKLEDLTGDFLSQEFIGLYQALVGKMEEKLDFYEKK